VTVTVRERWFRPGWLVFAPAPVYREWCFLRMGSRERRGVHAFTLANKGYPVTVIATKSQSSLLEGALTVPQEIGLVVVLRVKVTDEDAMTVSGKVAILGRGRELQTAREYLAGPQLRDLLRELHNAYGYVMADSAPMVSDDCNAVISRLDATDVLVSTGRTTDEQVQAPPSVLELVGVPGDRCRQVA